MQRTGRFWTRGRYAGLILLAAVCLGLLAAVTGSAVAQTLQRGGETYTLPPGSMPAWTVPVLRLVSATHVEPTTGIILSDTGLVLVPEDFAGMNDEVIVLDGGTDIIRNGRPARIERKFTAEGLQVLSVKGLKRRGVTLAATPPQDGSEVVLTAFPPAELIAQGEPPLSLPASVVVFNESSIPAISGETALPNVTGALVDRCGNLAGVSMAADVQTMESSPATRYQWRDGLLRILREMSITPREFDCSATPEEPVTEPEPPVEEPEPEPVVEEPVPEEPATEETVEEPVAEPEEEPVTEPLPETDPEELLPEVLPPVEDSNGSEDEAGKENGSNNWLWLLAALSLIGLGLFLHRLRKGKNQDPDDPAGDQPPGPGPVFQAGDEESETPPPQLDSLLMLQGVLSDGTPFEDACPVSKNAINLTIGRVDTDLVIDSRAVSRQHVSLNGPWLELTVSDLGSSNGTSINGVPCLESEIMFIEPGDILLLGDARCTIEIRPRDTAGGAEE